MSDTMEIDISHRCRDCTTVIPIRRRLCDECGARTIAERRERDRLRSAARRARERHCAVCGVIVPHPNRVTCSDACAFEHQRRRKQETERERRNRETTRPVQPAEDPR